MKNIVVTGIYTQSYKNVVDLQATSCLDNYIFDFRFISDEEWNKAKTSVDFAFYGSNTIKTQLVIDKIKENWGNIIIVADADLVFLKKTEKRIIKELKDLDCLFLKERLNKNNLYEKAITNINIGFVVIRCNEKNLKFWQEVDALTKSTKGWDQEIVNQILSKPYDLNWKHLSDKFANGNDVTKKNVKNVLITTSCGSVAKKYGLSKVEYLQNIIKFSKSRKKKWFGEKKNKISFWEKIFSLKNSPDKKRKIIRFCGLKLKVKTTNSIVEKLAKYNQDLYFKQKKDIQDLYYMQKTNIQAAALHPYSFGNQENLCHGENSVAIIACGPSAKYYKRMSDVIHIGINRAFLLPDINLDYLFIQDYLEGENYQDMANNYNKETCKKYYGIIPEARCKALKNVVCKLTNSEAMKANAKRYILEDCINRHWAQDLSIEPFGDWCGCIFSALQFALYLNPKRIYLVGCDCSNDGHFHKEFGSTQEKINIQSKFSYQMDAWLAFKEFVSQYNHDVEIISVNPVGLKGMFKDVYTKSYLADHPELKDVEMLGD